MISRVDEYLDRSRETVFVGVKALDGASGTTTRTDRQDIVDTMRKGGILDHCAGILW